MPNSTTRASLLQNDNEMSRTLAMTKTLVQILRSRVKSRYKTSSHFVYNRLQTVVAQRLELLPVLGKTHDEVNFGTMQLI